MAIKDNAEDLLQHMAQACRERLKVVHNLDIQTLSPVVRERRGQLILEFFTGAYMAMRHQALVDKATLETYGIYVRDNVAPRPYEKIVELSNGQF